MRIELNPQFSTASSARNALWVEEALRRGNSRCVSTLVPDIFESYVAIYHPASLCRCSEESLAGFQSGNPSSQSWEDFRWDQLSTTRFTVVYGSDSIDVDGVAFMCPTQYRRDLNGSGWVVDRLEMGFSDITPLIQSGDTWIGGPTEGELPDSVSKRLIPLLRQNYTDSDQFWFAFWEGFGFFSKSDRRGPAVSIPGRRWLLFQANGDSLGATIENGGYQTANMIWPIDESWCMATEIDAEVTYIGGPISLIESINSSPDLETTIVSCDDKIFWFGDFLQPVIDHSDDLDLPVGFEGRTPNFGPLPTDHAFLEQLETFRKHHAMGFWQRLWHSLRNPKSNRGGSVGYLSRKKS